MRKLFTRMGPAFGGALLLLLGTNLVYGQQTRSIEIGEMGYTTNEAFTQDALAWPRGRNHTDTRMLESYGITIGIRNTDNLMTPEGVVPPVFIAQVMDNKFSDIEAVTVPEPGAFQRVLRNPYPTKILDGNNWTQQFDRVDPVDPGIPADAMIYNKVNTWAGIQIERWVYAFAHDEYDDMVILEYRFTNTSGNPRQDVYFALHGGLNAHTHYPGDLWGNYYGATYANYVAGDASADSMRMYYSWNGDRTVSQPNEDTKGVPHPQYGYFQEPQFMGYVVLHADRSTTDESDDPAQPHKAGWSQRDLVKQLSEADHPTIYSFITDPWDPKNPIGPETYSKLVNADGEEVGGGMYRVMRTAPGTVAPEGIDLHQFDPELEQEKNTQMSFGPYQMQPDEDVRIVMAFVGGAIPSRLAIDAGRAYNSGADPRPSFGINPLRSDLSYDDMHGNPVVQNGSVYDLDGSLIASAGELLTQEQKDRILDMGQKLVFTTASQAIQTWKDASVKYGSGTFNIPFAPAAPSLTGFSEGDRIRLEWEDNTQDNSRGGNIVNWRIYREYKRPPALQSPTDTTFLLLTELPVTQTDYTDTDVVRGEQYYYYITAVNEQGIESSRFQNRTGVSATKTDEALTVRQPAVESGWQDQVVVVPNPYHTQAAKKYPGRRLNFLNLPAYARIHIYTMTGDLVQTLEHDVNAGDEDWQRQETFSTMEIVSGVYLYVVEKLDGPGGSPTGEQAIGKFVVIK